MRRELYPEERQKFSMDIIALFYNATMPPRIIRAVRHSNMKMRKKKEEKEKKFGERKEEEKDERGGGG